MKYSSDQIVSIFKNKYCRENQIWSF